MIFFSNKFQARLIQAGLISLLSPALVSAAVNSGGASSVGVTTDAALLIIYILMALVISFLCSISEAVLLSVTPSYIEALFKKGTRGGARLKRLKQENVDRSLAAILTLNTIAHTVGAIGAGAKASVVFGSTWFGLFSAVMTLMILFFSEIIPKTIGAVYWTHLVGFTIFFVQALIIILYPIVWISEQVTTIIARGKKMHIFSRDEFIAMARVGAETGDIRDNESRIIRNLFHLGSLTARDIMTPSTVITALPEEITVGEAINRTIDKSFSRIPLYNKNINDLTGFVLRDEILLKKAQDKNDIPLFSLKREILIVPDTVPVSILLDRFLKDRQHIAMVVDEHGVTKGLVTLEDLIETLIGVEIVDEIETIEDMRVFARKLWKERARSLGIEEEDVSGQPHIDHRDSR